MKIECVREKIATAILQAARFSGKHPTLPVLSAVLCEAKNKSLYIKATNLDVGIQIEIPARVESEGVVAVSPQVVAAFLLHIVDKQVILEEKGGNLFISAGPNKKTTIKCLPSEDFPSLPTISKGEIVLVEGEKIAKGIEAVVFSASVSEIKPELSSVYIYPEQNSIVFVSTDSFRLAEKKIQTKGIKDFAGIIIPFKNALEIARVLSEKKEMAEITFTKHHISIHISGIHLLSRLIDGTFPDYKQIIPKEEKTCVVALKQDIVQAVKITSAFANKFNQVTLRADPKNKLFVMESKNAEVGESSVPIDAALSGEGIVLNVNNKYFADCIPSLHQDSVSVSFDGTGKPILVQGVTDRSFTYLLMPMNR